MTLRAVILALVLALAASGPAAHRALAEEPVPAGDEAASAMLMTRAAQDLLNLLGYDAGPADGILGSRTRSAVLALQRDRAEAQTGTIDRDLLESLVAEIAERQGEAVPAQPVVLYRVHLEHYDYSRLNKPIGPHTRAYFRFKNNTEVPVTGIEFAYAFKDPFGETLYSDSDKLRIRIAPKAVTAKDHYYYWEDIALVRDAYDKMASAFRDGGARAEVRIKRVVFADGTEVAY
jgi:hypothetical protein